MTWHHTILPIMHGIFLYDIIPRNMMTSFHFVIFSIILLTVLFYNIAVVWLHTIYHVTTHITGGPTMISFLLLPGGFTSGENTETCSAK